MKFGRFLVHILKPIVHLLFPFSVIGAEKIPANGKMMICCNHISLLDPVFLLMAQKQHIYFMAKKELFSTALSRWFFGKQLGVFAVDRGKGDFAALDHAIELVDNGKIMGIFPEGTRSKTGQLGRIKSGAAYILSRTGADLLPVCILTKHQKVRLFRPTKVVFGEPIPAAEFAVDAESGSAALRAVSRRIEQEFRRLLEERP